MTDVPTPLTYTYTLLEGSNYVARSDGLIVPDDPANVDWQLYEAWLAAGNAAATATVTTPAPVTCLLWQLEAVCNAPPSTLGFTPPTWAEVQTLIQAQNSAALTAFFNVGSNPIPANSATLAALATTATTPLNSTQVEALVVAASQIHIV